MRNILTISLAAAAALALASGNRAGTKDEARTILDKAIEAAGGAEMLAKNKAHFWKAKGTFHAFGMPTPYLADYYFWQPDKLRFEFTMEVGDKKVQMTMVANSKEGWEKAGPKLEQLPKEKHAEMMHTVHAINVAQLVPLLDKKFTVTSLGETKVGDIEVVGIRASTKGRRDVNLYFDKKTMLLAKTESRVFDEFASKEVNQENFFTGYKDKNGAKIFEKMTIKRDGKLFLEEEFSDQKTQEKLDEKLFARPE